MKKFFRHLSFRRKLLISFVTLSCIPVLLVGIAAYHLYTKFIINMTETSSIETIDLVCDDIDSLLNDTWSLCSMLTGDIKMQQYLRMDFTSISDQYSNDLAGSMDLASISTYRKDIFGVYVLGQNGGRYKSNYYSFKSEDQRETSWYRSIAGSGEATWFPSHEGSFIVRSSISDNFITVGLPVIDKASGMVNGIVAADIKEDTITQKIKHSLSNGIICIIDQNGDVLFQSNAGNNLHYPIDISQNLVSNILQSTGSTIGKSMVVPDSTYLVVSRTLRNSNWRIAGIIDRGFLTQNSKDITHIVMLLLLIIAFSSLYIAMLISQSVYKPVKILYRMMEDVENGDFSVRYTYPSSDEFGKLGKNFNQMLERTQELINQIYEEQKKLKNSELKALQAQIQPHFLYNSLDSIMWLLRMDKNRDAEKMLAELSTLFKISLSKGNEVITISEELRHITSYLFITNMIYSKKFEYVIECDPVLYSYKTLKLLLQPLVENAIAHAVPLQGQKVFIQVRIHECQDSLVLSVQDISRGMDSKVLENLRQQLEAPVQPDRRDSGYGLYNVNERIHILFGKNYGLTITSEPEFGTEVCIRIPKLKGDDTFVPGNTM
ncbi:HAMP domain protein [Clostridiales bacterium 1_7_47FAA]|uniref:Sensor histidine kinase n=1 Tax=Enterocloster hominis (ex Hitch et al. 2024) TaxID=1917870 RepID=A0ABV1D8B5_9FIRM|nr:sensor histidine kinase [Lachnoclostridium pacaense]EEQ60078.1 HAMP domain protein [Clostridiales bacterium 1_7_47FAA]